jgi:hypothetical protein
LWRRYATSLFPEDAIARARYMKKSLGAHGSSGAYSNSQGVRSPLPLNYACPR